MSRGPFHGLRFQRRIRVLRGVHVNVSLSGVGVSVGGRGFHAGDGARAAIREHGPARHGFERATIQPGE
jgi:hypothetical protein